MPATCWRRNAVQVLLCRRGAGSSPWRPSVAPIAVAETGTPSRSNSPLMRWSPQRGFCVASRTIGCCTSGFSGGRPVWRCGSVQLPAIRRRCQRSNVPGVTKKHDQRDLGSTRLTAAGSARSAGSSLGRGVCRRRTAS